MSLRRVAEPAVEPLTIAEVEAHLRMGSTNKEPTPDAPTVALANPAAAGNVNAGAHRYRLTFVTADGETDGGQISDVATVVNAAVNGQVAITNIAIGGAAVTARRLYRTKAGLDDFFLVTTIADNETTSYTDNTTDNALGVGIPTTNTTTDPLLASFIQAARELVEDSPFCQALITQTWRKLLDAFPSDTDEIVLEIRPVQSIESFTYVDASGATVPFTDYTLDVDHFPGRVVLNYGVQWPSARAQRNAVSIDFKAGYGDIGADVPMRIRNAMKMCIATWWTNRDALTAEALTELPLGAATLLGQYRRPAMEMA